MRKPMLKRATPDDGGLLFLILVLLAFLAMALLFFASGWLFVSSLPA